MVLTETKRHVLLNKLNFLGYETAPSPHRVSLRDIRYMGLYENNFVAMDNYGLLPSFSRFMKKDEEATGVYRKFHKFMAADEVYLVNYDHPDHKEHCTSDELLMYIMKGQQSKVLDHDFTEEMNIKAEILKERSEEIREVLAFKQVQFAYKDAELQRKYSYYHPNREYSGKHENVKMKRVDDGTFTDNGYR